MDDAKSQPTEAEDEEGAATIPHSVPPGVTPPAGKGGPVRRFLDLLGPGLITGASDDDPSGIGTYTSAGAAFGFATLWTAVVTLPLMAAVQFICAKIGMVCGCGLAGALRRHYPRWVLYVAVSLLVVANTINAGTDIGAIAAAINLVVPLLPIKLMIVPVALAIVVMQVWGSYRQIAIVFKWLALTLFAYIAAAFLARPHWGEVLSNTFVPHVRLDGPYLLTIVAILGTTISPYLFFWQASEEVEEEVQMGRTTLREREGATREELRHAALDTGTGMLFCNVVFYFVILASAATLHANNQTDVQSATDAARALAPFAGPAAKYLFAFGLIGAGSLAVPVLSGSAAYAVAETFGWKYGLDTKPRQAKQFYAVIAASTLLGMLINFAGINPINALFWTAVINGLLSPPLLILIMLVSNNREVMGEHTNGRVLNALGWATAAVMVAAAAGMFLTWNQQ
ncbi:MAG TPA: divalent metal cation transporter [Pyrinomonadaceae bacterium]|jgi:NRAMP (natural resistance-associated macrophage protein)-like metal ion transporter|nr:divalent metal cation transporter [Pyrinomonadaceae bacterium]